jgi:hypothetical protein
VINATPWDSTRPIRPPVARERLAGTRGTDLVCPAGETAVRDCRARGLTSMDGRELLLAQRRRSSGFPRPARTPRADAGGHPTRADDDGTARALERLLPNACVV